MSFRVTALAPTALRAVALGGTVLKGTVLKGTVLKGGVLKGGALRALSLPVSVWLVLGLVTLQGIDVSRPQSDTFARKLALITRHGEMKPAPAGRRTEITEGELNSWFAFRSQKLLPAGVAPPSIAILGNGRLAGDIVIDLSAYAQTRRSGGVLDPWSLLGGRLPVRVTGLLQTKDGRGQFAMETAEVSGIALPKSMLQELVSFYSRTPDKPEGIRFDDPFELPANIRQIEVGQGQAVVVQ
jgi:hypothetical protein